MRRKVKEKSSLYYLSQQADPSTGCAQHAPLFSSFDSLGVQHTAATFVGAQQDDAAAASFFFGCDFCTTGISKFFDSIVFLLYFP